MRSLAAVLLVVALSGCQSLFIVRGVNRNVTALSIEVDWTTAQPPSTALLNVVKGRLENICDPSVSVSFNLDDDLSGQGHGTWTDPDCREFALQHKDSEGLYVIWAEGLRDGQPAVGGYSWDKRSCAVFPEVYGNNAGALQVAVEHEILHCLGLVDKFLKMQTDHKGSYGNHCNVSGCIMQPTNSGTQPCAQCMADLEAGEEK